VVPQIVYNHHQTRPAGTVIFVPPFRDPFNHVYDPLVVAGIDSLGNAIQTRFLQEGKPGATSRSGASYSTWFNGGLRTICYFHNSIGLLSEIIGNPTPTRVPLILRRQLPTNDLMLPVAPQEWHYRQSIEYSLSANRAVLDYASRHRETLLMNIYRMGRNSIARGRTDSWTTRPARLDEVGRHGPPVTVTAPRRRNQPNTKAHVPARHGWRRATTMCCARRSGAIRAASSYRPTRPDFPTA
jgi:hypothetical protein